MDTTPYLRLMAKQEASDLFFYPGVPVNIKVNGVLHVLGEHTLTNENVRNFIYSLLNEKQTIEYERDLELNIAINVEDVGRFRVNMFHQRGQLGMVIRYIKSRIPGIEELGLPLVLKNLIMEKRGLILVVGATGSGKSTTLASIISHRAKSKTGHILTIEDPIEFVYKHSLSVIGQREIGIDTHSYDRALESAMREAPDVILIGEIRTRSVMHSALHFSITGHLCLSTLHANNAVTSLERVINFFPEDSRASLMMDLSLNLVAIISQRLIQGVNGKSIVAVEVMLNTPYIAELIQKGKLDMIGAAMENGGSSGMISFDQALYKLYIDEKISAEEAVSQATSKNNVALKIKMASQNQSQSDVSATLMDDRVRLKSQSNSQTRPK